MNINYVFLILGIFYLANCQYYEENGLYLIDDTTYDYFITENPKSIIIFYSLKIESSKT